MNDSYTIFAVSVFLLSITPGPCMLLALYSGMHLDFKRTQIVGLGDYTGLVLYIVLSLLGVGSVILSTSPSVFSILQYAGASYLLYLGITPFLPSRKKEKKASYKNIATYSSAKLFKTGFISLISNPKAILFYVAFFPQFIRKDVSILYQFFIMTIIVITAEWISFTLYALGGKTLQKILKNTVLINIFSSTLFIGLALWLFLK